MRDATRVIRLIDPAASNRVRDLVASDFARNLFTENLLPNTRALNPLESAELISQPGFEGWAKVFAGGLVLEHQRVPFPSYPYEWCPEMLFAAGELTLELQLRALAAGLTLKDATPLNVLFRDAQPVFVDLPSFVPRSPESVVWIAYAQFVRTFLFPLMLSKWQRASLAEYFLVNGDGLDPSEVYSRLGRFDRARITALEFVVLPTWLGRMKSAETAKFVASSGNHDSERTAYVVGALVRRLKRALHRVKPSSPSASVWTDYMDNFSYEDTAFAAKELFVREALRDIEPRTILDVGCNTGHFCELAAKTGASVVAIDKDVSVLSKLWVRASAAKLPILPLAVDFVRPSPSLGWRNRENDSFLARAHRAFDAALLLAVVHHLSITQSIPFRDIFGVCAEIVTKGLVVEFVPPGDPMFTKIIRNREHLYPRLTQPEFETAFSPWFTSVRRLQLPGNSRWLYLLRRNA